MKEMGGNTIEGSVQMKDGEQMEAPREAVSPCPHGSGLYRNSNASSVAGGQALGQVFPGFWPLNPKN